MKPFSEALSVLFLAFVVIAPTPAIAGPFGIDFGTDISELDVAESKRPGMYKVNPPDPHADFISYTVYASPTWGVCKILAYTQPISTGVYGDELVAVHTNFKERLSTKYGKPSSDYNRAKPESRWAKPKYFMMALEKRERQLAAYWIKADGADIPEDTKAIVLDTIPISLDSAMLTVGYEGTNRRECMDETNRLSDGAL